MRYIGRLLWLLFTIVAVVFAMAFATSNSEAITLQLWPFQSSIAGPTWLFILGGVGLGAIFGGLAVWISFIAIRTQHWRLTQKLVKTERRASEAEEQLAAMNKSDSRQLGHSK